MDGQVVGDAILAAGTVGAAYLAARSARYARRNARTLARTEKKVAQLANGDLRALVRQAVEEVAHDHPRLIGEALIDENLRDLLDAMLRAAVDDPYPDRRTR